MALRAIEATPVGHTLVSGLRNRGIELDIVTDAEFAQRAPTATDAVGVFGVAPGQPPTVLVRASALKSAGTMGDLTYVLSHELTHAAQYLAGENAATYSAYLAEVDAPAVPADQAEVGATLMKEAGAEYVASAIRAEQTDPARFAQVGASKRQEAAALNWKTVNESGYNPKGYQLEPRISPTAVRIVESAFGRYQEG
jgi:hypothetical protein